MQTSAEPNTQWLMMEFHAVLTHQADKEQRQRERVKISRQDAEENGARDRKCLEADCGVKVCVYIYICKNIQLAHRCSIHEIGSTRMYLTYIHTLQV